MQNGHLYYNTIQRHPMAGPSNILDLIFSIIFYSRNYRSIKEVIQKQNACLNLRHPKAGPSNILDLILSIIFYSRIHRSIKEVIQKQNACLNLIPYLICW
jgi:hypothetical protein